MMDRTTKKAWRTHSWILVTLAVLGSVAVAEPRLQVAQLNDDNWAQLRPQGPDAIAGRGDWALTNGRLCAVVSDLDHESGMTAFGGILVDLGHCGAGNDQWLMAHLLPNMDTESLTRPHSLRTGYGARTAFISVHGQQQGLRLESRYELGLDDRDTLRIVHTVTRVAEGPALTMLSTMILHPGRSLTPFALNTTAPEYSLGFNWLEVDRSDQEVMVAAMQPGNLSVLMGAEALLAPVSYGVKLDSVTRLDRAGEEQRLDSFAITDSDYSLFGALSDQPVAGSLKPGAWEFLQSLWMDLAVGESIEMNFSVLVKPDTNVARVTNRIYAGPVISGRLQPSDGRLHIADPAGHPLTSVTPRAGGHFSVRLPAGVDEVLVRHESLGHSKEYRWQLSGDLDVGVLHGAPSAQLVLPQGDAMRLTFIGLGTTPDPSFGDDYTGTNSAGKELLNGIQTNNVYLTGGVGDPEAVLLPPGDYRVYASRGLEYSVTSTELSLTAGARTDLAIEWPLRAVQTPGTISADLHVHSGISFDSAMPLLERVRSFAAMGAEILVTTEHNRLYDYSDVVAGMGLAEQLTLVSGVEFTGMAYTPDTPATNGHSNAFPVRYQPREFSGGLPAHEGVPLRELIQWSRQQSPAALFQLNHPRVIDAPDPGLAYFDHLGVGQAYDPTLPLTAETNSSLLKANVAGIRDVDFDLLEVLNGPDMAMYRSVQRDWFSLLMQGWRPVATANSDSHDSSVLVGVPTNYVTMEPGTTPLATESALLNGLRAGRVVGTNGPQLAILVSNGRGEVATLGDTISGAELTMSVAVTAADWIPVDTLVVYVNGEVYRTVTIERGDELNLALPGGIDGFVVVEVTGTPDERYEAVLPGFTPLAFSNPVWLQAPP